MIDTVMLLVALLAFASLVVGWMVLPDAPEQRADAAVSAVPRAARAA
jgi:hypothetical protein